MRVFYRLHFKKMVADGIRPPINPIEKIEQRAKVCKMTAYRWWRNVQDPTHNFPYYSLDKVRNILFPYVDEQTFFDKYTEEYYFG